MDAAGLAVVAAAVFGWGVFSGRLQRWEVTAPIAFVSVGLLLSFGPAALHPAHETVKVLAELTLVLVLFSDASRVHWRQFRADIGLYLRLLGLGLPLTIALGMGLALVLFAGLDPWLALLIGAALAPTDAALGVAVIENPVVPARIRRVINVESGLNDGIATPFVMVAIAGAAAVGAEHSGAGSALVDLGLGVLIGAGVGGIGGWLLWLAQRRAWVTEGFAGAALLGLAVCSYASALAVDGNGFIAAFVGGMAFGVCARRQEEPLVAFAEETGGLASLLVWLMFGAIAVGPAFEELSWQVVAYAVLSLTVVRMLPVAMALVGSGLSRATVGFVGWFGPRGLASVIFALLALEDVGEPVATLTVTVITITVLLSVIVHGVSADPLARKYGALASGSGAEEAAPGPGMPTRRLTRHQTETSGDQARR